jgi:hypothetical protein
MIRRTPVFAGLVAALLLAGCSYYAPRSAVYGGPTPQRTAAYLDGTMPQAAEAPRRAQRTARKSAPATPDSVTAARQSVGRAGNGASPTAPENDDPFLREDQEDRRLKQRLNICRGC